MHTHTRKHTHFPFPVSVAGNDEAARKNVPVHDGEAKEKENKERKHREEARGQKDSVRRG